MIKNKKAFTLIEVLIVVLIIGILAAIAVPQYQTAVNKSRYSALMPMAKAIKDSEEQIFMANGEYTEDLGILSVTPGIINTANTNIATQGNVTLSVVAGEEAGQDYTKAVDNRNTDNTFVMYFANSPRYAGEIHCEALTTNEKAQQLCKSYGPVATVTGTDNTYTAYVLQGSGEDAGGGTSNEPVYWNNTDMTTEMYNNFMSLAEYYSPYLLQYVPTYISSTQLELRSDGGDYHGQIEYDPANNEYILWLGGMQVYSYQDGTWTFVRGQSSGG